MAETAFDCVYADSLRIAKARAAKVAAAFRLNKSDSQDLEQEALLALWSSTRKFDPRHASWRTFAEVVIGNRLTSCIRSLNAQRRGYFRCQPLSRREFMLAAPDVHLDLQADIQRVLAGVAPLDRAVARSLFDHSASETSRRVGLSRPTVYRSIGRLRAAFKAAGFSPKEHYATQVCPRGTR